jgi:hypothetical protein
MTGPEHHAAAEKLLDDARHAQDKDDTTRLLAMAQVHATLALIAPVPWRPATRTPRTIESATMQGLSGETRGRPEAPRT